MKALYLLPTLGIIVSGCASYSIWELRSAPSSAHREIDKNYRHAYKSIVDKLQQCLNEGYVKGFVEPRIRHAVYSGIKSASVTVSNTNLGREHYLIHIGLTGIDEKRTQLHVYAAYPDWGGKAKAVEGWVSDPNAPCVIENK